MNTEFKTSFFRDVKKAPRELLSKVDLVILEIESAGSLNEIAELKKLTGYKTAYRVKINAYRLCFYYENDVITIARFLPRKEVYRYFP